MSTSPAQGMPFFIADHLALDFLNTVAQVEGQPVDAWQCGEDVMRWLLQAGLAVENTLPFPQAALLAEARQLREVIREMVRQKKSAEALSTQGLNGYLSAVSCYSRLEQNAEGRLNITRIYAQQTPAQLLAPVAEQAAKLLVEEDFTLVRECEHPECTLWFLDRTKAHRRRWCSMAMCGNRAKVARFRQQQK